MDKPSNDLNTLEPGKNMDVNGEGARPEKRSSILDEFKTVDTEEALKKYDAESAFRVTKGITGQIVTVAAVAMSLFHLFVAYYGRIPSAQLRAMHLGFVLFLIFLLFPSYKKKDGKVITFAPLDYLMAGLGAFVNIYLVMNMNAIANRAGVLFTMDLIVGGLCILLVLEAGRRCLGKEMTLLAIAFLAYAYLGPHLPDAIMHRGFSIRRIIDHMSFSPEGIFGIPLGVSATVIVLFILFGAILNETGLGHFFTNLAIAVAGDKVGGPAKVSVLSSGLLGMINGSAAANVVMTGNFTIPLMKRVGYTPLYASAVEAVASTGGQMMPPVMGAAAFIMAEMLGVPYRTIMFVALIPCVLYYVALWFNVEFEARRMKLPLLPKDSLPDVKQALRESGFLLLPVVLLIYLILDGYSPTFSAFWSIMSLFVVSSFRKHTRMNFSRLVKALETGAKQALSVAIACAVAGLVVGVVTLTGIGLMIGNMITSLAGGQLLSTLIVTSIVCIVLGMGMPTSAAYIVSATVCVPALTRLGVPPIVAHLFCLYYAALSAMTPPVALASYASAGLAGTNPNKTSYLAVRIGILGFVIPYMFVYNEALLMRSDSTIEIIWAFITASIGCYCLAGAMQGYLKIKAFIYERLMLFTGALLLIASGLQTDVLGIALFAVVLTLQKMRVKKQGAALVDVGA